MSSLAIQKVDDGVVFRVKVVPGSGSPTRICGLLGELLKIKVAAPPEKGKANKCLIAFLAKQLDVNKNDISIISGHSQPVKQVQVYNISAERLLKKLNLNKKTAANDGQVLLNKITR